MSVWTWVQQERRKKDQRVCEHDSTQNVSCHRAQSNCAEAFLCVGMRDCMKLKGQDEIVSRQMAWINVPRVPGCCGVIMCKWVLALNPSHGANKTYLHTAMSRRVDPLLRKILNRGKIAICDARETCLLGGVVFLQKCDQIVHKSHISFLNKQFFFAEIRIDLTCLLKSETQMMRDQGAPSLSARTSKLVACLCCWSCPLAHVCAILVTGHSSDGPNRPG